MGTAGVMAVQLCWRHSVANAAARGKSRELRAHKAAHLVSFNVTRMLRMRLGHQLLLLLCLCVHRGDV